ncbi:hypothetical protein FHX59_005515 [Paraburkholderia silvatlantica]|uniref:Uncharacterized protein n=1 Tax=Paraburkholderia silvatlantica TaxID=321895 RepID=A0A2U0ZJG5_9BURK|nr:hypothetical protein [Paraburkholderia silvatlantica]PVY18968.1 hypothetical protein C7411_14238 [Paraburkholderia silvatlantica]PXW24528.1 hypothetical protein C7413_14538 [Paraburkholderia silvatlantica]PYE16111.1 hypothetical protein C7410_13159 [Paraburkholderia silvatlantica]TDQ80367.1 hypothetical protein C7412_12863 [Paraburkholderia silvatlantica]
MTDWPVYAFASNPHCPWMAKGTRWPLQVQSGDERDQDSLQVTAD